MSCGRRTRLTPIVRRHDASGIMERSDNNSDHDSEEKETERKVQTKQDNILRCEKCLPGQLFVDLSGVRFKFVERSIAGSLGSFGRGFSADSCFWVCYW